MVLTNVGLNQFRDACSAICSDGQAGTGTTSPSASDTALETPVVATDASVTITTSERSFQVTHFISSTTATGNAFTEWGIFTSADVLLSRAVSASVNHTSNDEITKITTFNVVDK